MLKLIMSWVILNRSDLLSLGFASHRLVQAVLACWGIYLAFHHGDTSVAVWDIAEAIVKLVTAGNSVTLGVAKLYQKARQNGKGAPTADNDRAPFRQ